MIDHDPRLVDMRPMPPVMVLRYRDRTRMNHWFVAILFFCAALTGLAIFHPLFYPLVYLFGGGVWARILHPFMGVVMTLGFFGLFWRCGART